MIRDVDKRLLQGKIRWYLPAWMLLVAALVLVSRLNYLLFHSLVEMFAIVVSCGIFMISWHTRRLHDSAFFLVVGCGSLSVAVVDLLHTLAYKNMGVFPGSDSNLPTQLWIIARLLQSASLLMAPLVISRRLRPGPTLAIFGGITSILIVSAFWGLFPACFREGVGLTPFKLCSEYLIVLLLAVTLYLLRRRRQFFSADVFRFFCSALLFFMGSELAFTFYTNVFDLSNLAGHLFNLAGFALVYRAVIETGLSRPFDLLFRNLKQSEERYRSLYENTPVMLHSIDSQGRMLNVSNYWLSYLGYDRDEVSNRRLTEFLTEESRQRAEETVMPRFFRTGAVNNVPYQVIRKGGEVIDVLLSAVAEYDEAGRIERSLAVMVDVSELKRVEEEVRKLNNSLVLRNTELEMVNRELETFNYTVSHDLRTPLTAIRGYADLLTHSCSSRLDEQSSSFIKSIRSGVDRMNQIISSLIQFSHIGRLQPEFQDVDLSCLTESILADLQIADPARQVDSAIEEGVHCQGDPALLHQALTNLLENAWKYTGKRDGARIEFGMEHRGDEKVFFVRDNGDGFDMDQAHRLFSPFERLHDDSEFQGTGIGLATVQRIIELHGGRIWAEGTRGEGATFYFVLGAG